MFPETSEPDDLSELRKLAEQSIEQAQRAVSFFFDAANRSASDAQSPTIALSRPSLSLMEHSVKDSLEHLRNLFRATSFKEAMSLQTKFLNGQVHRVGEHITKIAEATANFKKVAPAPAEKDNSVMHDKS
jgi:hypothetical protein